jgi:hypothetical protein
MRNVSLRVLPLLLLLSVILLAFTQKPVSQVSFSINASVNNNVNTGSFTSSGLALSSGTFIENYTFNGKKTHSEVTFTYTNGTITAKTHSDITITGSTTASGSGTWLIVRGTGAYTGVKGSGSLTLNVSNIGTTNESITEAWSGNIK